VSDHVDPSAANFAGFKELPRDQPIHMLNLLRFHEQAIYPKGHENGAKNWSGRRAYEGYGKTSGPVFRRVGGTLLWRGAFEAMVIGPDHRRWDDGFVAQYPSAGAFLEMITDPEYRRAVVNRTAAVADSRLVRFAPRAEGSGF
jgi:uncharacterized protein (DUF1330 family)